jgi:hypothetical protein
MPFAHGALGRLARAVVGAAGLTAALATASAAFAATTSVVVAVGVNRSFDPALAPLAYAETDAERFTQVMRDVGGVSAEHATVLRSPTAAEFAATVRSQLAAAHPAPGDSLRLILYFSGHADERGLHFRTGALDRSVLHDLLREAGVATKIVFMDSCFSGSIASKGVAASAPFNLPKLDVEELSGSVFLTAASAREAAYESEQLSGGIFTHDVVAGLQGAADGNSDGLVTVDELYQYVYRETHLRSMSYPGATVQRPEYHADLHGQGAIVLSQPRQRLGTVRVDPGIVGYVHVVSLSGLGTFQVAGQVAGTAEYHLPEGSYRALIRRSDKIGEASFVISRNSAAELRPEDFVWRRLGMMTMASLKGSVGLGTAVIGMVSLRRAIGEASFTSRSVEAGDEFANVSTATTRVSMIAGASFYDAFGHLDDEKVNISGLGLSLSTVFATAISPLRFAMGYTFGRENQEWFYDADDWTKKSARNLNNSNTYRAGFFLPLSAAASNPLCLSLLREVGYVQDRGRHDHRIDLYSVGLALQP